MKINYLLLSSIILTVFAKPRIEINGSYWSKKFNILCCRQTTTVVRETYDGVWGMENWEWCGLGLENTKPINDIPPSPPAISNVDLVDDLADECDISDAIMGDSLAKEAPFRFGYNTCQADPYDKTQAIINLLNILREEALIDAIGIQSYLYQGWSSLDEYK